MHHDSLNKIFRNWFQYLSSHFGTQKTHSIFTLSGTIPDLMAEGMLISFWFNLGTFPKKFMPIS